MVLGIPVDFILFALTLLGVALFHQRTLQVALTGLIVISLYKIAVTGFNEGAGVVGWLAHMQHEWVVLTNLLGLLLGFALLARHFEDSGIPRILPRFLPDDWKGAFVLLVMVFVLSSFLDNIAAALIGGTVAASVFKRRVHIGYLAAIVAASNAGGSGSVVGDTTTTMMWIDGVAPLDVVHAYAAALPALLVFGVFAARQQQAYQPIQKDAGADARVDWVRVGIVAWILMAAIVDQCDRQYSIPAVLGYLSVYRRGGLGGHRTGRTGEKARVESVARCIQGQHLPALAGGVRVDDAGGGTPRRVLANRLRFGFRLGGV